jgi:hypothetical protein
MISIGETQDLLDSVLDKVSEGSDFTLDIKFGDASQTYSISTKNTDINIDMPLTELIPLTVLEEFISFEIIEELNYLVPVMVEITVMVRVEDAESEDDAIMAATEFARKGHFESLSNNYGDALACSISSMCIDSIQADDLSIDEVD